MSTSALSRANKESILDVLARSGPLTKGDIARKTGLSVATASRLAETLLDDGFVIRAGEATGTGGRPSRLLQFNDQVAVTLALDVRGSETEVALVDLGGNVCATETVAALPDPEARLQQTLELAVLGLAYATDRALHCVAIGVSVPGPVEVDGTVAFAPALSWQRVPLGSLLHDELRVPVAVDNDANLLALGEYLHGRRRGAGSLISVAVFEGVGLGIIEGGRVWRGGHGAAGQLGRMLYDTSALGTDFTGFGDLETRLGSVGIARRSRSMGLAQGPDAHVLRRVHDLYVAGDPGARELLGRVFDEFAMSLTNLCAILDPECVVLAGLFSNWSSIVVPALAERLVPHVLHQPHLSCETPGLAATVVGAASTAFAHSGGITNLL